MNNNVFTRLLNKRLVPDFKGENVQNGIYYCSIVVTFKNLVWKCSKRGPQTNISLGCHHISVFGCHSNEIDLIKNNSSDINSLGYVELKHILFF